MFSRKISKGRPVIYLTNRRIYDIYVTGEKMTLFEAIKSGKPHRRKLDKYVYFVPHVGGIGYSQSDVMAEDWEIAVPPSVDMTNVLPLKKRGRPRKEKK